MAHSQTNSSAVWITWEKQTRNKSMANAIGIPLYELLSQRGRALRYLELIIRTTKLIFKENFRVVFAQNPSIVLAMLIILLSKFLKIIVIIDAHNSGVFPKNGTSKLLMRITKFIVKNSHLTIVTNDSLASTVVRWGGRPFVMPDPAPHMPIPESQQATSLSPYVFCITSWSDDEPVREIIEAARIVDEKINVVFSGNYKKILTPSEINKLPSNVHLAGFISEEEFITYLKNADAAIDLTTRDDCLVCGAYEAMSTGTPCILSDTSINRSIFSKGFIFTKNTALEISKAILDSINNRTTLERELKTQLQSHTERTKEMAYALNNKIKVLVEKL